MLANTSRGFSRSLLLVRGTKASPFLKTELPHRGITVEQFLPLGFVVARNAFPATSSLGVVSKYKRYLVTLFGLHWSAGTRYLTLEKTLSSPD